MKQKRQLTQTEREAITAKYQRRIIELGTPIFGPPDEQDEESGANVMPFPDPNAEGLAMAAERGRAKAEEFQRRILDATIQMLETAPPLDEEPPPHRKPGDLVRTANRLMAGEVDLPDPDLDRGEVAASLEAHAEFERAKLAFGEEMDAVTLEALSGLLPILEVVKSFALDVFHEVKRWAEEDPDGPAAEYCRELNRAWRQGAGRSRGRHSQSQPLSNVPARES
jgi:hypothetical protein